MMKVCQNCQTENPVDAVFCSQCGMSLLPRAAPGKEPVVEDATDPTAKRLRRIARVLAVIWAAGSTLMWSGLVQSVLVLSAISVDYTTPPRSQETWILLWLFLPLVAWIPTAVAWRWEAIGGLALLVAALLVAWSAGGFGPWAMLLIVGPPLAAGFLFIASWRTSKTTAGLHRPAGRRKWYAAIAAVAMLSLVILVLAARFLGLRDVSPDVSPYEPLSTVDPAPSISAEGRYVAFASLAADLVPDDTNERCDIFVHDRHTGETVRVSVASDGKQGNGDSIEPSISADGRYVAFASRATNLVPGNRAVNVFVHDRYTGQTERIPAASDGREADGSSGEPSISFDGRYVAFASHATNLVPGDTNDAGDIFVRDRLTGETVRVSVASDGREASGEYSDSGDSSISADGRYVAFSSDAGNLVPGDTNDARDVFFHDRQTSHTERVSVASDGTQADDWCFSPSISADGRYVAFRSNAGNLVPGVTNEAGDIFVRDRQTGQTERVSVASDGTQADDLCFSPSISGDGRYVAFYSLATNLVPGDTNHESDVFVHDRETGETVRISVASDGTQGNGDSDEPSISADGRHVAFVSSASNLVPGDTNDADDVFVHDRETGETVRVSVPSEGPQTD